MWLLEGGSWMENVFKDSIVLKYLLSPIQVHKGKPLSESMLEMNAAAADVFANRDLCYIFVFIMLLPLLLGSHLIVPFSRQVVSSRSGITQMILSYALVNARLILYNNYSIGINMTSTFLLQA